MRITALAAAAVMIAGVQVCAQKPYAGTAAGIPTVVITSAFVHDSQAAIPMAHIRLMFGLLALFAGQLFKVFSG